MRIHNEQIYFMAWAAGCLNVISYLGLGGVFSTNMTGNTTLLAIALSQGDAEAIIRSATALLGFCAGVFIGGLVIEWKHEGAVWTRHRIIVMILDDVLLLVFAIIWLAIGAGPQPHLAWLLLIFSTFAMGVQSALTLSLAFPGIATTYFTGTLTNLMAGLARLFHWRMRARPDETVRAEEMKDERAVIRLATLWIVYSVAALVSSVLFERIPPLAIFSPLTVSLLIVVDVAVRKQWQGP